MLEYDRIDISEGIDIKKCKENLENIVYVNSIIFWIKIFKYGPYLCDGCYDMPMKVVSMQNLAIINYNGNHYRVNFVFMNKKDVYNLIKKMP